VVILRHRATGLRLPLLDVHMTSHVEVAGRARTCCPDRVAAYGRAMGRVTELGGQLRRRYGRAIIGGDWNVDWPADHRVQSRVFPYAHLWRTWDTHWAKLPATGPTHGSRRIDALWWTERSIRPVDSDTLRRTASDHNFIRLTVRLLGT
jgi:endonuclease/exonuclease/phosphatase (EEP) superfamily protein YafD